MLAVKADMSFAEELRRYKAELGVSLDELAVILGTGQRTVAAWITGRTKPYMRIAEEGALVRLQGVIDRTPPCEYIGR